METDDAGFASARQPILSGHGDEPVTVFAPAQAGDDERRPEESGDKVKFPSCRHILALMAFLGFANVYALRVNLSVALVAMVNATAIRQNDHPIRNECPTNGNTSAPDKPDFSDGEFAWDSNTQALILGAFFYGYIVTQIPGGWLAEQFGGKWLLGGGVLCTAVLTLFTPIAARTSVSLLVAVRVLEGIGEGVTFPAMHAILSKWAPPYERSKLGTFVYSGAQLGTVISMPISGLLCRYGFAGGWPSVFYLFGSLGCVWFVFWAFLCYDSPETHPRISLAERRYIQSRLKPVGPKRPRTPWLKILTSVPFWAIAVAHMCNNWGFYTLLTTLPTYMKQVLKFDISQNGILSGLPYFVSWITMMLGGQIADNLRQRHILSTTTVRKIMATVGQLFPAIFLVAMSYLGCNPTAAVVMVTLSVGMSGFGQSGYGVNHLDIAPPFAGTLMGLTNALATIPGFAGPALVGALTNNNPSMAQWRQVFFVSAEIYVFGVLMFIMLASGDQQSWSVLDHDPLNIPTYSAVNLDDPDEDGDDDQRSPLLSTH